MSLGHALLGLLNYRSMTGYDLKKTFDSSIVFFWSAQMSQIYRDLNSLEKKGLVESEIEPQKKRPDKKVYQITEKGKKNFLRWLNKFPKKLGEVNRSRFLMRVFFSSKIKLDDLAFEIQRFKKEKEEEIKKIKDIEEMVKNYSKEDKYKEENFYWDLIIRLGYKKDTTDIEWADECLHLIEQKQKNK
ncbi:MAG: PadR family transcriptional regulator [Candidatus Caldatribacteriota bacterium]|nr:PadR family transcriptional regulator [Candidatus Caldatribacteriota bacterium]